MWFVGMDIHLGLEVGSIGEKFETKSSVQLPRISRVFGFMVGSWMR